MMLDPFTNLLGDSEPTSEARLNDSISDNLAVALDLARRGFAVFPVRDWSDGDGRKPISGFPDKASTDAAQIREWWKRWPDAVAALLAGERNGITVLDIDRKNGRDGLATLQAMGLGVGASPMRTRTPSGGWHLFFRYDPRLKNSASKVGDGLDVRTTGGFVIAPGATRDGSQYAVEGQPLGSMRLPDFPEALIPPPEPERLPVPLTGDVAENQQVWAIEKLEQLARNLAATKEGGRNDALNTASLWAGGAAARNFLDRDAAHGALKSACAANGLPPREFESTFKRSFRDGLNKPIHDFPPPDIDADSEMPEDPDAEEPTSCASGPLDPPGSSPAIDTVTARLNRRHAVVAHNGRTLISTELPDGMIGFGTVTDIHTFYENDRVLAGGNKTEPASKHWLRSTHRRTYNGVAFAPGGAPERTLNLWRGWAVKPKAGASCKLFLDHVRNIVCRGNEEHTAFVIGWLAHMVQRPEQKPGVALVLKGPKGAGKDTVADYLARMIGTHHVPTVAESDQVVGKFNRRLETALLLHVQEGSWAGDRKAEGVLKYLVTSDRVEIERKGIDSINLPSVLRIFISANAEWVVPASPDERRWAVFNVSGARRGDEAYFAALRAEMNGDGPAALLHYLRTHDLVGFNVRKAPETEGLLDQKLASLRNAERWWFDVLSRGELLSGGFEDVDPWATAPLTIGRDALRDCYVAWMSGRRFDSDVLDDARFGRRIRDMLPAIIDKRPRLGGTRIRQYVLPTLDECRAAFNQWIGAPVVWEDVG